MNICLLLYFGQIWPIFTIPFPPRMKNLHPLRLLKSVLPVLPGAVLFFSVSCGTDQSVKKDTTETVKTADTLAQPDSARILTASLPATKKTGQETDEHSQKLIGKILPDLEDSTLLRFVYGSCYNAGDNPMYNWGPQLWSDGDSVIMQVAERLGDENTQLIYIRGEQAITAVMHNIFNETTLLLNKTKNGWLVSDAVVDEQVIDFSAVEQVAMQDNRFLVRYSISGTYAGGVMFASDSYNLLSRKSVTGPTVSFITGSSNTASSQCMAEENGNDCDCYDRTGETKFSYDKTLQCFLFRFNFSNTEYECEIKNGKTTNAKQTWYMNADTAFMGSGHDISEWGEKIGNFTTLPQAEIRKLLQRDK